MKKVYIDPTFDRLAKQWHRSDGLSKRYCIDKLQYSLGMSRHQLYRVKYSDDFLRCKRIAVRAPKWMTARLMILVGTHHRAERRRIEANVAEEFECKTKTARSRLAKRARQLKCKAPALTPGDINPNNEIGEAYANIQRTMPGVWWAHDARGQAGTEGPLLPERGVFLREGADAQRPARSDALATERPGAGRVHEGVS